MQAIIKKTTTVKGFELISLFYKYLLRGIGKEDTSELIKEILSKGLSILEKDAFILQASQIIQAVKTNCHEEHRANTVDVILDFLNEKGIETFGKAAQKHSTANRESANDDLIVTPDYRHISHEEVLTTVNSYEDFKQLYHSEDKANSYFSWAEIFRKISPALTIENIRDFINSMPKGKRQSELFSLLSQRSLELGNEGLARELADNSLYQSSPSGWSPSYDGGTRLHAMQALQKINKEESYKKALATLTDDITSTTDYDSLLASWEEISPLLSENSDPVLVWQEIENYLTRLLGNAVAPEIPQFSVQEETEAIQSLFQYLTGLPGYSISAAAKKILDEMQMQGD